MFLKMAPLSWFAGVHKKGETIFAENNWVLGLSLEKKIFISTDWWSFKATEISFFNLMLYDLWERFQQEIVHLQYKLFFQFCVKMLYALFNYGTSFFALNRLIRYTKQRGVFWIILSYLIHILAIHLCTTKIRELTIQLIS